MLTSLPNLLTMARIAAILPIALLMLMGADGAGPAWARWAALALYIFAGITDWLDGHLARRLGEISAFGRFLDPIADKLLVATLLLVLAALGELPGWHLAAAALILAREILVSGLREYLGALQVVVHVTTLAKWKTGVQMFALGLLVLGPAAPPELPVTAAGLALLWLAAALTLWTGGAYMRAGLIHMQSARGEARGARSATPRPETAKPQTAGGG